MTTVTIQIPVWKTPVKKKITNSGGTTTQQTKSPTTTTQVTINPVTTTGSGSSNTGSGSTPLTSTQTKEIANQLNSGYKDSKGKTYKAIDIKKDGTYKVKSGFEEYVALNVINNTGLTQSQKDDLLYNKFKVPENKVRNVLTDNQYKYQNK